MWQRIVDFRGRFLYGSEKLGGGCRRKNLNKKNNVLSLHGSKEEQDG